jgi:alpha-tubulin suppressor-like RCC1 family protein
VGPNSNGECNVTNWKNIIDIDTGIWFTLGITKDNKFIATGWNEWNQCDVNEWNVN